MPAKMRPVPVRSACAHVAASPQTMAYGTSRTALAYARATVVATSMSRTIQINAPPRVGFVDSRGASATMLFPRLTQVAADALSAGYCVWRLGHATVPYFSAPSRPDQGCLSLDPPMSVGAERAS